MAETVTTVKEARELPFVDATAGKPVRLTGVVTYLRDIPQDFNFNLHDATGGVMVYPQMHVSIKPGQRVSVTGLTATSVHGLRITDAIVVAGEMERLPEPAKATISEILDGRYEGNFVEIEGVIRAVRLESREIKPQRLALDFGSRRNRLNVWLTNYVGAESRFQAGSKVRLRGVAVRWKNPRGQTQSTSMLVNDAEDVTTITDSSDPQMEPVAALQLWSGPKEPAARFATRGVVTYAKVGEMFVIQDGDRAMRIYPAAINALENSETTFPNRGELVDVVGFPSLGEYTVELEDARWRTQEKGQLPLPEEFSYAAAVLAGRGLVDRDARLIQVTATLRSLRETEDGLTLEMESKGDLFPAYLTQQSPALSDRVAVGAELKLTGICSLHLTEDRRRLGRQPGQFSLQLSDADQVVVVGQAPWWTTVRLRLAIAAMTVSILLVALWGLISARKNARLKAEIARRMAAETRLDSDRRRVAADLHDTLEQTLMAVGLQLNAAGRLMNSQPEFAGAKVELAQQLLSRGRQEVRDAVWDLHADAGSVPMLGVTLESACSDAGDGSTPIHFQVEGADQPMPALVIAQCTRLVREAIHNALKHANAQQIRVHLCYAAGNFTLRICDDGVGFQLGSAAGPDTGHFGLSSMKERVQRLGGTIEITSSIGHGTTILATIPIRP